MIRKKTIVIFHKQSFNVEKTKVMRISRQPFPVKIIIDQNIWRMFNLLNILVAF